MKQIMLIALFATLAAQVQGQCLSGNCQNGNGVFLFADGARYIGQFKNGEINGTGSCYYTDGSRYQGEWAAAKRNGKGTLVARDGSRQEGEWRNNRFVRTLQMDLVQKGITDKSQTGCISGDCTNGQGIYIYPSGAVYIGNFEGGEIHGIGVCYYPDGSKYQGEWVHRYPEGKGTKTWADKTTRTGNWKRGQAVDERGNLIIDAIAQGKDSGTDGVVQNGCISGNCTNGEGTLAYPDGSRYEGFFRNGKPSGAGTFLYPNEDQYVGGFQNGMRNGSGRLSKKDGTVISGIWKDGEYMGETAGAAPKVGCQKGDCQNGRGQYIFRDGARYEGDFRLGVPSGVGVVTYTNGEKYEGEMFEGEFNGRGTLTMADGSQAIGFWQKGTYMGDKNPYQGQPIQTPTRRPAAGPSIKIWAVIVGVSSYNHMPVLRYPDNDAYQIYAFLKSPEGGALPDEQVRVLVDEDATKANIKDAMQDLFGKAGPNDLVFLYFSGHGLKGAFLPIDFDGFNNKLFHDEINDILARSSAKFKLCIADACHSGSLLAMRSGQLPNVLTTYYETLAKSKGGTALIMSSKSEETSLESSGLRQGVFSHFLIRGLKGEADSDRNRVVTLQELFKFVDENVRTYTANRQSPVIQGSYDPNMTVGVLRQ